MTNNNKKFQKQNQQGLMKIWLYVVITILLLQTTLGIGIVPGSLDVDYGQDRAETYYVYNNEKKDMDVILAAQGELAEYIEFSSTNLHLSKDEETKAFQVIIKNPERLAPGTHETLIIAMETTTEDKAAGTTLSTRQAVISKLNINVPYEDKFAHAELLITPAKYGEPINFVVTIKNKGTKLIEKANARIEIYGPTNELLTSLLSDSKSIKAGELRELVARYDDNLLNEGRYLAKTFINYDGNEIVLEKTFSVGDLMISLENIIVKEFKLGDVAKFEIVLKSQWNEKIPDIFADMIIKNENGRTMTKFTTASIDMEPEEKGTLISYWDTKDTPKGRYDTKVILHFLGRNVEKNVVLDVNQDSIGIGFSPTGQVIGLETVKTSKDALIILVVVGSLILNLVILFIFLRRKKS